MSATNQQDAPEVKPNGALPVLKPVLHHVNLKTARKDEMIAWYGTVCGMTVNYNSPLGAFLSNDGANHRLALLSAPDFVPDPDRRTRDGYHHAAFEYANLGELDSTYRRLHSEGIDPLLCVDHRIAVSYYYEDPDGNLVEMQCDGFGDWDKSSDFMHTELLQITDYPLGIIIDPALVAADVRAGISLQDMHSRSENGDYKWAGELDLRLPPPPPGTPALFQT